MTHENQAPEGGPALTDEALLGAIARGWCHPGCTDIEMDATLAQAIAHEVRAALAAQPAQTDDNWRRYATERETTAQQVIERHRREIRSALRQWHAALSAKPPVDPSACLEALRAHRDTLPFGEERSAFNAAIDRLDVAISKEIHADPAPAEGDERIKALTTVIELLDGKNRSSDRPSDYVFRAVAAARAALSEPQPKGIPVAWSRQQFIHDDDGYSIGTDEPELHWGKEPPDDETGWHPLYAAAGVTTRDAALEEAAQLCERWNTTPGRKLAGEIRALAAQAPAPAPAIANSHYDVAKIADALHPGAHEASRPVYAQLVASNVAALKTLLRNMLDQEQYDSGVEEMLDQIAEGVDEAMGDAYAEGRQDQLDQDKEDFEAPAVGAVDARDAARWRTFIGLDYAIRAEWAANLSLAPVLTQWVDNAGKERP